MQVGGWYAHHLRVRAINRQAQNVKRIVLRPVVRSPVERRIDHHLAPEPRGIDTRADFRAFTSPIEPENNRDLDARVLALSNPDVAMIQRRRAQPDDRFAWIGIRIRALFASELLDL